MYLFGTGSSGDVSYIANYFVTPNTLASSAISQATITSGVAGGSITANFIRQPATNSIDVFLSYGAGRTLTNPYLIYEVFGNKLSSVT